MLTYIKGTQSDTVVTLNESKTLTSPYFLFVFTHISLKTVITKIVNSTDDVSDYPDRCNIFQFNTISLFANAAPGQWFYEVYEQESSTNTDPTGLTLLECGKVIIKESITITRQGYEPTTTSKGYAG